MIDRWRRKRKRGEEKKVGAGGRSEGLFEERGERNYRFKGSWDGVINECGSAVEAVIESLEVSRELRESGWKGGSIELGKHDLKKQPPRKIQRLQLLLFLSIAIATTSIPSCRSTDRALEKDNPSQFRLVFA